MAPKKKDKKEEVNETPTRIAVVSSERCKPKKCKQECKRFCPVVKVGKLCVEVTPTSKIAWISEELCIGCGICVKKCPFDAIQIINLPSNLQSQTTHRYGPNSFKLHRLPMPRPGQVLGLVGTNGIGKSTALKILAGKTKPNLGRFEQVPDWETILAYFRGSELQNYFKRIVEDDLKASLKPQYVDSIPRAVRGSVKEILERRDDRGVMDELTDKLDLKQVMDRNVENLSGGELQRFAIAVCAASKSDVYMVDEPSSYLDVRQRLKAAQVLCDRHLFVPAALAKTQTGGGAYLHMKQQSVPSSVRPSSLRSLQVIRDILDDDKYVVAVEHDLSVLDYLSDFICCLYGKPGAYGVVTMPASVRDGLNIFLAGFVPSENMRFREEELNFKVSDAADETKRKNERSYEYPSMVKRQGNFTLTVDAGSFNDSEILVMLGENGTGKTTFIRMLAGVTAPDEYLGDDPTADIPRFNVSYKPQKISPKFESTVRNLLHSKIRDAYLHPQFKSDVMTPLRVEELMDQEVQNLSGGELQRVAIALCLGKPADLYLIDEPSAYLDSEQRIIAAKVIKRFIMHSKKTAFIVEHDFIMSAYLADRVIVYTGQPSVNAKANEPQALLSGMNSFLKNLDITFRRDPTNYRPRINKLNSQKDHEQKVAGTFYYIDEEE